MAEHSFHPLTGCSTQIKEGLLACHRLQSTERDKILGRTSRRRRGAARISREGFDTGIQGYRTQQDCSELGPQVPDWRSDVHNCKCTISIK
ncbi:hypothetical protein CRYUN_Cryun27aG0077200 [Craigia yunnanensis]